MLSPPNFSRGSRDRYLPRLRNLQILKNIYLPRSQIHKKYMGEYTPIPHILQGVLILNQKNIHFLTLLKKYIIYLCHVSILYNT
jgi:hypothetical protein